MRLKSEQSEGAGSAGEELLVPGGKQGETDDPWEGHRQALSPGWAVDELPAETFLPS